MTGLEIREAWLPKLREHFAQDPPGFLSLDFLTEVLDVAPDGFSGTDKEYYFKDGSFYALIHHWDGGNMFAGCADRMYPFRRSPRRRISLQPTPSPPAMPDFPTVRRVPSGKEIS